MTPNWKFFLLLILISLIVEGFFSMMEMACVSFNKVRLQYYVSKGYKRAKWISYLLNHPTRLFGTTLIGVNAALQFGSECARRFYISLDLSPDWAALSQVFLVLIFAELSPMFAARRYSEHVSMLGIPIIYFFSKIMTPIVWFLNGICFVINKVLRVKMTPGLHLTREELQKAIEARDDKEISSEQGEFDTVVSSIFSLKNKIAKDLMHPLDRGKLIPSNWTTGDVREALTVEYFPFLPIYHHSKHNIVAIAYPRDLLKVEDFRKVKDASRQPWFILENNSVLQILKQFKRNNQSVAVVLNDQGSAVGILTLDTIIEEIFGPKNYWVTSSELMAAKDQVIIEKSFPCESKVDQINRQLNISLRHLDGDTLEDLMVRELGHLPNRGEFIRIDQYELKMEEAGLIKGKKILIRTVF